MRHHPVRRERTWKTPQPRHLQRLQLLLQVRHSVSQDPAKVAAAAGRGGGGRLIGVWGGGGDSEQVSRRSNGTCWCASGAGRPGSSRGWSPAARWPETSGQRWTEAWLAGCSRAPPAASPGLKKRRRSHTQGTAGFTWRLLREPDPSVRDGARPRTGARSNQRARRAASASSRH